MEAVYIASRFFYGESLLSATEQAVQAARAMHRSGAHEEARLLHEEALQLRRRFEHERRVAAGQALAHWPRPVALRG